MSLATLVALEKVCQAAVWRNGPVLALLKHVCSSRTALQAQLAPLLYGHFLIHRHAPRKGPCPAATWRTP